MTDITLYETIDIEISANVLNYIKRHIWYLVAEMIYFPLFDPEVPNFENKMTALDLSCESAPSTYQKGKPVVSFDNVHDAEKLHEQETPNFSLRKPNYSLIFFKEYYSMG